MQNIVLITGISGSAKSVALNLLADAGYICVDNLPVRFLREFISTTREQGAERAAVPIAVRTGAPLDELPAAIQQLRARGTTLRALFLDAYDHTLRPRYSESRRRHPLTDRLAQEEGRVPSLQECIDTEREMLAPLREQEHTIDTSDLTPGQLRAWVRDLVRADRAPVVLT